MWLSRAGVVEQADSNPPPPSPTITFVSSATVTVNYGDVVGETTPVPAPNQLNGLFNDGNAFTTGPNTLANYFAIPEPIETVNHSFSITYDSSQLPVASLPADGECQVTITITPLEGFIGITGWDLEFGTPLVEPPEPFTQVFDGLNRNQVSDGLGNITSPSFVNDSDTSIRFVFNSVAPERIGGFTASIGVLLADGTTISATENLGVAGPTSEGAPDASIKELIIS